MDESKPASEQFDLTTETNDDLLDPDKIHAIAGELEKVPDSDLSCHDSEFLATLAAACKHVENAAEDARKDGYEDELDDRVSEGERVGPLVKQSGTNTWVDDSEGAFAAVADAGEDPMDVAKVSIGDLRDVLGDNDAEEFIGSKPYTYFRREA